MAINRAFVGMSGTMRSLEDLAPIGEPYRMGRWHPDVFSRHGYVHEAGATAKLALLGGREGPTFVILCRARSGSTLLVRLLEQVADIHCRGEALHFGVLSPRRHLARLAALRKAPVHGCKLLSYQLIEVQRIRSIAGFLRGLADDGCRILHLTRETLPQALSLSIAQQTNRYVARPGERPASGVVTLDPALFVAQARLQLALLEVERAALRGIEHMAVSYEQDLMASTRHQSTVDRICRYLGAEPNAVVSKSSKLLPTRFEEVVANAGEIRSALERAGLASLFEEAASLAPTPSSDPRTYAGADPLPMAAE
ncbi:hypothetical protein P2H44_04895 [Albimonas sp. CAU 1670]|uniref:hypothetical protein n=1 Tax=Albimonas sp. CAU 1670 TaxID=3032599 RepID=UPI0023DB7AB2|nr:hypothetical protein [Albimonas sp. CAU 1670]MDF2231883.1 hypothetical protein [Albimonas sp. CAU 1670]